MNNNILHIKTLLMAPFNSNALLTGCIVLASVDVTDLTNYALRATLGGGIWLGFKLLADYLQRRKNSK